MNELPLRTVRLQVTHVYECRNGDSRVHLLADNADGSGKMFDIRFEHCDRSSRIMLERLDLNADALDYWRAANGGQLDITQLLLAQIAANASAIPDKEHQNRKESQQLRQTPA